MSEVLEIDGSFLEGGGQILRIALSLSCILRRAVRIVKIRANRSNPGLSTQHMHVVNVLQQITDADVRGNMLKSTELEFRPKSITSGFFNVDTLTAASISLIIQAALPVLIFADGRSNLNLVGGTNVSFAPQVDFMTEVFRPNLELFGVTFDFELLQRGYYPTGGGKCKIQVSPVKSVRAVTIENFGSLSEICGWCFVAGKLPLRLAMEMKEAVETNLKDILPKDAIIEAYKESASIATSSGSGLLIKAVGSNGCHVGASLLGKSKVLPNNMGKIVAEELKDYIKKGICIDRYVQDQLIIFMGLADGISRITTCELTDHTKTAMHVVTSLLGVKFLIQERIAENKVVIECQGIGHINKHLL